MAKRMKDFSVDCRAWADVVWENCVNVGHILTLWRVVSYDMGHNDQLHDSDLDTVTPSALRKDMDQLMKDMESLVSSARLWAEAWGKEYTTNKKDGEQ